MGAGRFGIPRRVEHGGAVPDGAAHEVLDDEADRPFGILPAAGVPVARDLQAHQPAARGRDTDRE